MRSRTLPPETEASPDSISRSPAFVFKRAVDERAFEEIRSLGDTQANFEPSDVYQFSLIAASDGLDSYFTIQDKDRSLIPMAADLKRGQSVLGNHAYDTFSYGSSYDGTVTSALEDARQYEATFNSRYAENPTLRAKNWLVGDYFIARNITLNGQSTNDLIRAMELGAVRKVSISFSVGAYECGICGRDMVGGAGGSPRPDSDSGCLHFPGLEYGDDGLAHARMVGNSLLETSMVYKNSSPSAMLLRKAEMLAMRGLISPAQIGVVEERYQQRLPSFQPAMWQVSYPGTPFQTATLTNNTVSSAEEVETMATRTRRRGAAAAPAIPSDSEFAAITEDALVAEEPIIVVAPTPTPEPVVAESAAEPEATDVADEETREPEAAAEPSAEPEPVVAAEEPRAAAAEADVAEAPKDDTADSILNDLSTALMRVLDALDVAPDQFNEDMVSALTNMATELDAALTDIGATSPSGAMSRQYEAKARIVQDVLGRALTVEAIRSLKADAELGQRVYGTMVEDAVKARVGVQGEDFDSATYRQMLLAARNFDFVSKEAASWEKDKQARFTPGRQVVPRDLRAEKKPTKNPVEPQSKTTGSDDGNILARR